MLQPTTTITLTNGQTARVLQLLGQEVWRRMRHWRWHDRTMLCYPYYARWY